MTFGRSPDRRSPQTPLNTWMMRPRPNPQAQLRLFCFPYAGGGASMYYTWPDELPAGVEVCAINLPGREARLAEPPITRLDPLVRALADALAPALTGRFAFVGHSLGSLVAFELTRELVRRRAPQPVHLLLSGRPAPQIPNHEPRIHALPDAQFIEGVRRYNGMPEDVLRNPELLELVLPVLRADFAINETYEYRPGPPLACPISAFGGTEDADIPEAALAAWSEQTNGPATHQMFPGDHFYVFTARRDFLRAVSRVLTDELRR
jgi:medium-chain acyl-[acyl-carrier-protein] hydrolase